MSEAMAVPSLTDRVITVAELMSLTVVPVGKAADTDTPEPSESSGTESPSTLASCTTELSSTMYKVAELMV